METVNRISKSGKILGHKKGEQASELTNAEIGIIHEKGSKSEGRHRRSFIQMPLELKLPEKLKEVGQALLDGITALNIRKSYGILGTIAENIIQDAFRNRGWKFWAENSPATIRRKHSDAPLIDTGQLRKSISHQVVAEKI